MSASHQLDQRARTAFREAFGYPPGAVAVAPGRINIVGEHTDYNQGLVLPAAIDRHIAVGLRLRRDAQVALRSDRYGASVTLQRLPSRRQGNWADYVLGVAREINSRFGDGPGFEAVVASDVPVGAGLSSSGALEVALAVALLAARGIEMAPLAIAQLCQTAENDFVGARTGMMDQFTALKARGGNAILLDCRSLEDEYIPLPDGRLAWLLADTRVRHELASSAYNRRRTECEAAARILGLSSLREATAADPRERGHLKPPGAAASPRTLRRLARSPARRRAAAAPGCFRHSAAEPRAPRPLWMASATVTPRAMPMGRRRA